MKNSVGMKIFASALAVLIIFSSVDSFSKKKENRKKEEAKLHYQIAANHFGRGDYIPALRELMISVEANSNDPESQYLMGTTYYMLKKFPEAETSLKEAIKLKKDYPDAYNNLGNVYLAMERWDEAIAEFNKCFTFILYQPNFPTVYTNIGVAYVHKSDLKSAEESFNTALKLNSKFCPARLNLADLLSKSNKSDEAILEYQNVMQICPDSRFSLLAQLYLGIEFSGLGKKEEACNYFMAVLKADPSSEIGLKAGQYVRLLGCK